LFGMTQQQLDVGRHWQWSGLIWRLTWLNNQDLMVPSASNADSPKQVIQLARSTNVFSHQHE